MNLIKLLVSVFTYLFLCLPSQAQNSDPVLFKIDNTPVRKSDFVYAYQKDAKNGADEKQNLSDFLQSFINFKLNVEEAKKQGLDKTESFIKEYSDYLEQMERPYLTDSISPDKVASRIYDRLKENIEISRLFIAFPKEDLLPKDTINAYNQIVKIRELAINGKEGSFEDLVRKYSQDTVFRNSIIPGYVGWKTAFSSPYNFEKVMYNTPPKTITKPIRTKTGYYILKVHRRRPDVGQVKLAHILFRFPHDNSTQQQKDSILNLSKKVYDELRQGADFEKLCSQYSFDKASAEQGGALGWFSVHRPLPSTFEAPIYAIKNVGDITQPIFADYGYHIFKIVDLLPLMAWDDMKKNILKAIPDGDYNEELTRQRISLLNEKYTYSVDKKGYNELERVANQYNLSDSLFFKTLNPIKNQIYLTVMDKKYTISDFIYFLENYPYTNYTLSTDILEFKTNDFILNKLIEAKRTDLFQEYPEFRHLTQEFHDGILYFDLMNKFIWGKAQSDRPALQSLFDAEPTKYKWSSPKYKGYVIHAKNKDTIKKAKTLIEQNKGATNLHQILIKNLNSDAQTTVLVEKGLWSKGENAYVDLFIYKKKLEKEIIGYPECLVEGKIISTPEVLDDALGQVVADYQAILEKEWMDELRTKYKIEVNENVLRDLK
ncbi:MAG: hypothetical protein RL662_1302 [Bacteroidota bacterium]|jgi:peptidyl-prolyl cis-trans isomerase SurA